MRMPIFSVLVSALLGAAVQAQESAAVPEQIVKQLDAFVGQWTVEGEALGSSLTGRWFARWAPQKHCLLIRYQLSLNAKKIFGNGVMGFDTHSQEILVQMFYSNGVLETARYKIASPGVMQGAFTGSAAGEAFNATCEARFAGPDTWTFATQNHTLDGRHVGGLSVHFVRMKEETQEKHAQAAQGQIQLLSTALQLFAVDLGALPTTEQGLNALCHSPPDLASPLHWNGPYLRDEVPLDPWSRPYDYKLLAPRQFRISSSGPDGIADNEDDVVREFKTN